MKKRSSTHCRGRLTAAHTRFIGAFPVGHAPINRVWAAVNRPLQTFYATLT